MRCDQTLMICLLSVALTFSFEAAQVLAEQQDEDAPTLRVNPSRLAVDPNRALRVDPDLQMRDTDAIKRDLQISDRALAAGRLTAVRGRQALAIDPGNLSEVVKADTIVLDQVRSQPILRRAPATLMANSAAAKTYALSWEILTPRGRLKAWGRDSTGLRLDGAVGSFIGSFDVALTRTGSESDTANLRPAVSVSVSAPGAQRIDPRPIEIARLGQWHTVAIAVNDIDGDNYAVSISANPGDPGDRIDMPVSRPAVKLTANPAGSVPGWGIGKTTISVQVTGMNNPEGYGLTLRSSSGTLQPVSVALNAQGYGETILRSSRGGSALIAPANAGAFAGDALRVGFEAPWMYLGLAMLGGLVGAFLQKRGREHLVRAAGVGAVTGVLMALVYSVGINWVGTIAPGADLAAGGEAVVFVLGALGSLVGVGVLVPKSAAKSAAV